MRERGRRKRPGAVLESWYFLFFQELNWLQIPINAFQWIARIS